MLRYPGFDVSAEVLPQGSGSVQLTSRGALNGPNLQAEARSSPVALRLLRDRGVQRPNAPWARQ